MQMIQTEIRHLGERGGVNIFSESRMITEVLES